MRFDPPLLAATFLRRQGRFLIEARLEDGRRVRAHCPNTGTLRSCLIPGWEIRLAWTPGPNRKTKYTFKMIHNGVCWIGVDTSVPGKLIRESLLDGFFENLTPVNELKMEVKIDTHTRLDGFFKKGNKDCYFEIKNVTWMEKGKYLFPDAVTERGRKHLNELRKLRNEGNRAIMFYVIQRSDGEVFMPAADLDPAYAEAMNTAIAAGVEVYPVEAVVTPETIHLHRAIPLQMQATV